MSKLKVVVLISGGGSNLQALIQHTQSKPAAFEIVGVISNRADARGLSHAHHAAIPSHVIAHRDYPSRELFDQALIQRIDVWQADLVVLAGFMRILSDSFVEHFLGKMVNIHPALLPKFTGLDTHQRAIDAGETHHGASVHYVIPELDAGPIIIQARLAIKADDSVDTLAARVLKMEHQIYPQAIDWIAQKRIEFIDGKVYKDNEQLAPGGVQTHFNHTD